MYFVQITDYRTSERKKELKEFPNRFVAIDWVIGNGYMPTPNSPCTNIYHKSFFQDRSGRIAITVYGS